MEEKENKNQTLVQNNHGTINVYHSNDKEILQHFKDVEQIHSDRDFKSLKMIVDAIQPLLKEAIHEMKESSKRKNKKK